MNSIARTFNQLYGEVCWGVDWDCQLNLSMSFGQPSLRIQEPVKSTSKFPAVRELLSRRRVTVKGDWWLWVYRAYWKISINGTALATSSSSYRKIQMARARLGGQKLTHVNVNPQTGATRFEFDLRGVLEIRRFERASEDELWLLYKPNGYVLSVYGNGLYSNTHASGSDKRREVELRAISNDS